MEEIEDSSQLHLSKTFQRGFSLTKDYQERIEYLSPILIPAITKTYLNSSVASLDISSIKNETSSNGLRNEGNKFFKKGSYHEAHTFYTLSVATAPESVCLSLAFANRSAALRSMGKLEECLSDIERALSHNYPESLQFKLRLRQAQCYRDLGQADEAKQSFQLAEENLKLLQLTDKNIKILKTTINKEINIETGTKKHLLKGNDVLPDVHNVSYGKNADLSNASSAIAVKFEAKFGRCLVATRDINIGDVLIAEDPFSLILEPEFRLTHCVHCTRRSYILLPCPSCDWAMYCSESCREVAAESYHRVECAVVCRYCRILQGQGYQDVLLLIRIVCIIGIDKLHDLFEKTNASMINDEIYALKNLKSHFQNRSVKKSVQDCVEVLNLTQCFQLTKFENKTKFASVLLKILNQIYVNQTSITEMQINGLNLHEDNNSVQINQVGCGIFLTSSLANHSCDPNTFVTYRGRTRIVRAARPIRKNSQITNSYGPTFDANLKIDRISYLKSRYYFDCQCNACKNNWPEFELLPSLPQFNLDESDIKETVNRSAKTLAKYDNGTLITETELHFFQEHLSLLCKYNKLLNQTFQILQEDFKNFYRSEGNCYVSY